MRVIRLYPTNSSVALYQRESAGPGRPWCFCRPTECLPQKSSEESCWSLTVVQRCVVVVLFQGKLLSQSYLHLCLSPAPCLFLASVCLCLLIAPIELCRSISLSAYLAFQFILFPCLIPALCFQLCSCSIVDQTHWWELIWGCLFFCKTVNFAPCFSFVLLAALRWEISISWGDS